LEEGVEGAPIWQRREAKMQPDFPRR